MVRIYYLKSIKGKVAGIEHIHHATLDFQGDAGILLQDTTDIEHAGLVKVAESWREAGKQEIDALNDMKVRYPIMPPPRDLAQEIDALKAKVEVLETKVA